MNEVDDKNSVIQDTEFINDKIKAVPKPKGDIDDESIIKDIAEAPANTLDTSTINSFTQVSYRRDQIYQLIDEMSQDPIVAAILETYVEDATEYNDQGQIIWAHSDNTKINTYVNWLIKVLQFDKNIYKWVYSMCKYGDIYFELFRQSDVDKGIKSALNEDIKIKAYSEKDKYVHYIDNVANPAEMFELTRFGKTVGFIKADINSNMNLKNNLVNNQFFNKYAFKQNDITIYNSTKFAHGLLEDEFSRNPEEVSIFFNTDDKNKENKVEYKVRKGQSILYNVFKIWRELSLLENSMILNRVTKSSIIRLINVEVGDMDKSMVGPHLQGIKSMIEQKAAISAGQGINEYTNPGPIENNIYIPTYNGKGAITTDQIGGDVNVGQLADIDYFQNKFYGAMRIPKQYFGSTEDGAGFNGGQSLAIISSRYAKMIKRIQKSIIQALTDVINLFLIDAGLDGYVNNFTLHMQPPTTQEEVDRRDNKASNIQIISDIMNLISDGVEDPVLKTEILKSLLADTVNNEDVLQLIQKQIDELKEQSDTQDSSKVDDNSDLDNLPDLSDSDDNLSSSSQPAAAPDNSSIDLDSQLDLNISETEENNDENNSLPTPGELGSNDIVNFA